ncbi:(2Fe-2S)-binding protein [Streptosporangium canum]|uniref:(2Fe-2S)-binding protein n=1 Tax=Streptosporangium canum TaxID=324952 RepID=UPI0036CD8DC3
MNQPYDLVRARPEPEFEISVDGAPVRVIPGQTIGAALHGAGIRSWRTTRIGARPRGLFCGIGVCFDCLVTVNGSPSLRACLTEARPGDRVSTGARAGQDGPGGRPGDGGGHGTDGGKTVNGR